ncbi:MAG: hypothetical protein SFU56_10510 [Capsulimonadales bacterium]|nr:hypothetical protein [Capsulimonadales bacterium]
MHNAPPVLPPTRQWIKDILSAVAFLALAFALGKAAWRTLGPFGGVFFLAVSLGLSWLFARAAWRGLLTGRSERGPRR